MVYKNTSVIPTGRKDIPLLDTRSGMVSGIITSAEGNSTNEAHLKLRRRFVEDVLVMMTNKN